MGFAGTARVQGVDSHEAGRPSGVIRARSSTIARELAGDLPCVRCGYNLRGLSVRAACPECATPVQATVLAAVDPRADELRPVPHPRRLAAGLMAWSGGALAAAVILWLMRGAEFYSLPRGVPWDLSRWAVMASLLVSWVGSFALIAPHHGIRPGVKVLAGVGVWLYVPLLAAASEVVLRHDPSSPRPYADWGFLAPARLLPQFAFNACVVGITLCLRPVGRLLMVRSMLLRSGVVDRQTLAALAAVAGVAAAGNLLLLPLPGRAGWIADSLRAAGSVMSVCGAALLTLGLVGVFIDCLRIRAVVLQPPLTMEQLLGDGTGEGGGP